VFLLGKAKKHEAEQGQSREEETGKQKAKAPEKHESGGLNSGKPGQEKPGKMEKEGLKGEMAELRETLQRTQAEFENSRKRLEKEKQDFLKAAEAGLVRDILPVLDSFDSAKEDPGALMIKKQLLAVLERHGLAEIKSLGQKFDPMLHECIMQGREPEKGDETVLEELQKGYLLNGMVLRHAKVKVNTI
jgi:molecular chaperone GrpE